MSVNPHKESQLSIHELEYRHELRDLLLAGQAHCDDARILSEFSFERAAVAWDLAFSSNISDEQKQTLEAEALSSLAEAAATGAAAVLSCAYGEELELADIELGWPDSAIRPIPLGGDSFGPSNWWRALASALLVRDHESIGILCQPNHIEAMLSSPYLTDKFWKPLCSIAAEIVQGGTPSSKLFEQASFELSSANIIYADTEVVRLELAPLLQMLKALSKRQGFTKALRQAIDHYFTDRTDDSMQLRLFQGFPIEIYGLSALAHDMGIRFDLCGMPTNLLTGTHKLDLLTVTFAYRIRSAKHAEDAIGFLDLRGYSRNDRKHALLFRDGKPIAHYALTGHSGLPRITAEFQMVDDYSSDKSPPPALDVGENVLLAELYAREAGIKVENGKLFQAISWLNSAINRVDEVIKLIPPSEKQVSEACIINPIAHQAYLADPGRFRRERLLAYRDSLNNQLIQLNC